VKPEYIILHHSLTKDSKTVSWDAIRKYHKQKGWQDIGYHYGIELVGNKYEIMHGRKPNEAGAHCKQMGMNFKSLGVCFVGNFDETVMTKEMFQAGKLLLVSLCLDFHINVDNIRMHREYATYKTCPGKKFPYWKMKYEVLKTLHDALKIDVCLMSKSCQRKIDKLKKEVKLV